MLLVYYSWQESRCLLLRSVKTSAESGIWQSGKLSKSWNRLCFASCFFSPPLLYVTPLFSNVLILITFCGSVSKLLFRRTQMLLRPGLFFFSSPPSLPPSHEFLSSPQTVGRISDRVLVWRPALCRHSSLWNDICPFPVKKKKKSLTVQLGCVALCLEPGITPNTALSFGPPASLSHSGIFVDG